MLREEELDPKISVFKDLPLAHCGLLAAGLSRRDIRIRFAKCQGSRNVLTHSQRARNQWGTRLFVGASWLFYIAFTHLIPKGIKWGTRLRPVGFGSLETCLNVLPCS